jgi:hypothetical protein
MNWQEILQWSRMGFIGCCALVVELTLGLAVGQQGRNASLQPSAQPCSHTISGAAKRPPACAANQRGK